MNVSAGSEFSPTSLSSSASLVPEVPNVYAHFSALIALARDRFGGELGGKLLLYGQLDAQGAAIALAANIAGAATLGVDIDTERLRSGIRHGFCDFVVNNLDEALRILKNEVRKKQPVSVALEGDVASTLRAAVERGLQPDVLAVAEKSDTAQTLIERGAIAIGGLIANADLIDVAWTSESAAALWLPKVDAIAAQALPDGDPRLRWLKFAPRYLGRTMAGQHYLQMTGSESDRFEAAVSEAVASGAIASKITIQRREQAALPPRR